MTKRRKGFLTFLCSLIPGAGEMYMGFFKQGGSIMLIFFMLMALSGYLNVGPLIYIMPVIWFYSFFHVHNLASLSEEEFYAVEDKYLFDMDDKATKDFLTKEKARNLLAGGFILLGTFGLWNVLTSFLRFVTSESAYSNAIRRVLSGIPEIVFAIILIIVGIKLIKGKKRELDEIEKMEHKNEIQEMEKMEEK